MHIEETYGKDPARDEILGKITALYVGTGNACVFGKKTKISSDGRTAPYTSNERYMLPLDFFAQSIGVNTEELRKSLSYGETDEDGNLFADAVELCERCRLFLHTETNGLVIYSKEDLSEALDWTKNTRLMRNIPESFIFEDVSGEEILAKIKERYPCDRHPRLIFTKEKIDKIRREYEAQKDEVYQAIFKNLLKTAEAFLKDEPREYEITDGIRLLYVVRDIEVHFLLLSAAYLVTGDEKYAEGAYRHLYKAASYKDFNPFHFLDVGEMALGLGLCYDWLYDWMGEQRRAPIRDAILHKAIYPINEDFDDLPRRRSWNWRGELADNWRLVISGVGVGAMAILDELDGEDKRKAERAVEQCLYDIRRSLSLFAPHGAYEEGHAYWYYGVKYFTYLVLSLTTATGSDYGYIDAVGMRNTNQYIFAMNGPVSTFDYHDCAPQKSDIPPETMLFARHFGKYGEALPRIERILSGEECDPFMRVSDLFLYSPELLSGKSPALPCDTCLPIAEVATMRTGFDREATWLGFHCDDPIGGEGHDHMDAGCFVLDALGESFFFDLGSDDYNLPNYLNCYRVRDEGHNVLTINPAESYSMKWGGRASIKEHAFSELLSYAIGDLTYAYRDDIGVKKYYRGAGLDKVRRIAVIRDELELASPGEIYWFAHTRADISISEDGKSARLTLNGKTITARIECEEGAENAVFTAMQCVPLPTSPVIEGQNENRGVRKLAVHLTGVNALNLAVSFNVGDEEGDCPLFAPLERWKI